MSLTEAPILAYHRITQFALINDVGGFAVSASQFERQMRYLYDHGYTCLPTMELLNSSGYEQRWRAKTFALTFDDGYEDFFTQAYPILRRYGFTATVFLVTDFIGRQSNWENETGSHLLTWEQIQTLYKQGISFGSHTCTHRRLSQLSQEEIRYELSASKERLKTELSQEIELLAYPHGDSNSEIQTMAMLTGYKAAYGVARGKSGRFNVWRRLCRRDDSLVTFILKLTRWYCYPGWLREETVVGQFLRRIKHKLSL